MHINNGAHEITLLSVIDYVNFYVQQVRKESQLSLVDKTAHASSVSYSSYTDTDNLVSPRPGIMDPWLYVYWYCQLLRDFNENAVVLQSLGLHSNDSPSELSGAEPGLLSQGDPTPKGLFLGLRVLLRK